MFKVWKSKKFAYIADLPDKNTHTLVGEYDTWDEARAAMIAFFVTLD